MPIDITRHMPQVNPGAVTRRRAGSAPAVVPHIPTFVDTTTSSALAGAANEIAAVTEDIQKEQQRLDAIRTRAARDMEARKRVASIKASFLARYNDRAAKGDQYATLTADAQTILAETRNELTRSLDPAMQRQVNDELELWAPGTLVGVEQDARRQTTEAGLAASQDTIQLAQRQYLTGDRTQRADSKAQIGHVFEAAVAGGLMTADKAARERSKAYSQMYASDMQQVMRNDPALALRMLDSDQLMLELDPSVRVDLAERAANRQDVLRNRARIEADRAERRADKALDERQAENAYKLTLAVYSQPGLVSAEAIDEAVQSGAIDADDGIKLQRAVLVDPATADDSFLVLALEEMVDNGRDVQGEILSAATGGEITSGTASRLLGLNRSMRGQGAPDNLYARGRSYLRESLMEAGPAAVSLGGEKARAAAALREYDVRVQAGEDPMSVADDIIPRARVSIGASRFADAQNLLTPRYAVGSRASFDIDASERALADAVRRGEISYGDAADQIDLLNRWRAVQAAAPPKGAR